MRPQLYSRHADAGANDWSGLGRRETSPSSVLGSDARCWLCLQPSKAVTMFEVRGGVRRRLNGPSARGDPRSASTAG
jgi:hypothetical protein